MNGVLDGRLQLSRSSVTVEEGCFLEGRSRLSVNAIHTDNNGALFCLCHRFQFHCVGFSRM
eukprot:1420843-Amphidinium_carterae.1